MARTLKILHLANHKSTNIGNGALILGLENTLEEDCANPVTFTAEPWDDYTIPDGPKRFGRRFVELCNQGFDCLLVGAAVTMDGAARYPETGMRFNLELGLWDEIMPPIIFYGISYRTWKFAPYHHLEQLGRTIRFALSNHKVWFSVRNDGTKDWLENTFSLPVGTIREVPDPAIFVTTRALQTPLIESGAPNIAVSLNDEDAEQRFGRTDVPELRRTLYGLLPARKRKWGREKLAKPQKRRKIFLEQLASVLDDLAGSTEANIVLCPHHHEDYQMIADLTRLATSRLKHQVLTGNWLPKARQAAAFYDFYNQVDLVLAMRVHAMSPSIGLGTPTIALCSQSRMTNFMQRANLGEFALDIFAPSFAQDLNRLAVDMLRSPKEYRNRLAAAVAGLREQARSAHREIEELILAKSKP